MSQDHDPLSETQRFEPIDPYNIGPDTAGAPLPSAENALPPRPPRGLKRLGRLGAPRLVALGAGVVIVVGGVAWGATALASSNPKAAAAQGQGAGQDQLPEDAGPTTGGAGKKAGNAARAAHVKITKLDAGSFTGTVAKGQTVTVVYGDDTRFGTKAHPLSPDQLQVGMTVTVAGARAGDQITALLIAVPGKKAEAPAAGASSPADLTSPSDPASPSSPSSLSSSGGPTMSR